MELVKQTLDSIKVVTSTSYRLNVIHTEISNLGSLSVNVSERQNNYKLKN